MRTLTLFVTAILLALPLPGQTKPNFTGTWKMNMEGAAADGPRSLTVKVEHKEPVLRYSASGETSEGEPFTEAVEVTTDGKAHAFRPELDGTITARWEGEELVFRAELKAIGLTQTARVRLSADGKRMYREVSTKSAEGESRQKETYDREQK